MKRTLPVDLKPDSGLSAGSLRRRRERLAGLRRCNPHGWSELRFRDQSGKAKSFYGSVEVNPATAKMRLVQLAEEIISNLASDPQAELKITVEINADFPNGASDQIKRAVSENAKSLGFKTSTWE